MAAQNQDKYLGTRVTEAAYLSFSKKVKRLKLDKSEVLRELIEAFVDDRMTITPPTKSILRK